MSSRTVWSRELQQLKDEWIALPSKLATEAANLEEDTAKGFATALRQAYSAHWVTGTMTRRVYATRFDKGKLVPGWIVKANAPHTHLFEKGTKKRFYVTDVNHKIHATGAAKPNPTAARLAPPFRKQLYDRLKQMLRNAKLDVSGDA